MVSRRALVRVSGDSTKNIFRSSFNFYLTEHMTRSSPLPLYSFCGYGIDGVVRYDNASVCRLLLVGKEPVGFEGVVLRG